MAIFFDHLWPNRYSFLPNIDYYNFGKIEFDWGNSKEESKILVNIIDIDNIRRYGLTLKYTDLIFNNNFQDDKKCYEMLNSRFKSLKEYIEYYWNNKIYILSLLISLGIFIFIIVIIYFLIFLSYRLLKKIYKFGIVFHLLKWFLKKTLKKNLTELLKKILNCITGIIKISFIGLIKILLRKGKVN